MVNPKSVPNGYYFRLVGWNLRAPWPRRFQKRRHPRTREKIFSSAGGVEDKWLIGRWGA